MKNLLRSTLMLMFLSAPALRAQSAIAVEETRTLRTYPFSHPDPVPILTRRNGLYPYFTFRDYSQTAKEQPWRVIRLENDHVRVLILPEAGGKIFGAVEKSTNQEFIYQNDVMKFRQVSLRGPWTSGGIEFNFGIVGHAPSTATPVNYLVKMHEDGSASCIVGTLDLPSRTRWSVEISIPADGAFFRMRSLWTNPTPFQQSYYAWMNNAVRASEDLQYFFPGDRRRFHGYAAPMKSWPLEGDRDLSWYKNNDFGSHHSHFVMGSFADYYGGYWHKSRFGFGHWARYDDMPGKKMWIWALSRQGAIWENLLTDTHGQYSEPQAGRYLSQDDHEFFSPYATDTWTEIIFPFKEIGGMVDACAEGVLNVRIEGDSLFLGVCALQSIKERLQVHVADKEIFTETIVLEPMEVWIRTIHLSSTDKVSTKVGSLLSYTQDGTATAITRPIVYRTDDETTTEGLFRAAAFKEKRRQYEEAIQKYSDCVKQDPGHSRALTRLAELYARRGELTKGLGLASRALSLSMYDPSANYVYGVIARAMNRLTDAKETLGWAARSMEYRSNAYCQMAEIAILENDFETADEYAKRALDFNTYNLRALEILAISLRIQHKKRDAHDVLHELTQKDPLNPVALYEKTVLDPSESGWEQFKSNVKTEIPHESFLELALSYEKLGQTAQALHLLSLSPKSTMILYWMAYLERESAPDQSRAHLEDGCLEEPHLVFPFRRESIPVLKWIIEQKPEEWKPKYYLGLLLWAKDRSEEAVELFRMCGKPDFAPYHIVMGQFEPEHRLDHYSRARLLDPADWNNWHMLIQLCNRSGRINRSLKLAREAVQTFPRQTVIALDLAHALFNDQQYEPCLSILDTLEVLPYEGGWEAHHLFMRAHAYLAMEGMKKSDYHSAIAHLDLSKTYPEHLGTGEPYNPDTRLQDFLIALCYDSLTNPEKAFSFRKRTADYTKRTWETERRHDVFGLLTLERLGEQDRVQELLEEWDQVSAPQILQWYHAYRTQNRQKARELENQGQTNPRFLFIVDTVNFIQRWL